MGKLANKIKDKGIRKFFSSDSYDRNLELMKLLTTHPHFKKIVAEARKRLNIPTKGIPSDDKATEKWYDWLVNESDRILESKEYWDGVRAIKEKIKSSHLKVTEGQELGRQHDDQIPLNHFGNVAKSICKQFNLPIHFKKSIQKHILTNKIDAPQHNYQGGFYEPWEKPWEAGYIPINIYTQLTKDEWKELKHYVANLAKSWKLPRHPRIPKIDDYIQVDEAHNNRTQTDHITGKNYEVTSAEIADVLFGDPAKDSKVRDILRKAEKLRKQRLVPKERGKK